jgi:hypothetical protein
MDLLLDELRAQETRFVDTLLKSSSVDGADRASRSSLRAELERARAEQIRLQEASRAQQAQLDSLRSHAHGEPGALVERGVEPEPFRAIHAVRAHVTERARTDTLAAAEPAEPAARGSEPSLAAAIAQNASRITRVERAVEDLRDQLGSIDDKLARILLLGSGCREATPVGERERNLAGGDANLSDQAASPHASGAMPATPPSRARSRLQRSESADAKPPAGGASPAEADGAVLRLEQLSLKYEALKRKFARQTIREAELHGYLMTAPTLSSQPVTARAPAVSAPTRTPPSSVRSSARQSAATARPASARTPAAVRPRPAAGKENAAHDGRARLPSHAQVPLKSGAATPRGRSSPAPPRTAHAIMLIPSS